MHAGSFDRGHINAFFFQERDNLPIGGNEAVFGAAGDPDEMLLGIRFGVHLRKIRSEVVAEAAGAETNDPRKFVGTVQAREKRFRTSHGKAGDSAGVTA